MPICGFNKKMEKGLTALTEGLVEHGLKYRCEKNGETIAQGIKREISDMTRLLLELPKIDDSAKRLITEGIVKYAQGVYLIIREKGIDNYKEVVGNIIGYFHYMDDKFYPELEGKPNDMVDLVKLLDKKQI